MKNVHLRPAKLIGTITAPPSKSVAHRALICAALSQGTSEIMNIEYSDDMRATLGALEAMGAQIVRGNKDVKITGVKTAGAHLTGLKNDDESMRVECKESGSTLRFMVPLFALNGKPVQFVGAKSLFARPLTLYKEIYAKQGLDFIENEEGLYTKGKLESGAYKVAGNVSSQFISGLLFALPLLKDDSLIEITPPIESRSYIEITRSVQAAFGVRSEWVGENTLLVPGRQEYAAQKYRVEGDWSQAAVPAVLAAVCGGIEINGLKEHSAQGDKAILEILRSCGADAWFDGNSLHIQADELRAPKEINLADCPDLGPILCAFALFCEGETRIVNAGRLRIKESDRIASVEQELKKFGAAISSTQNSITIQGTKSLKAGVFVKGHNDHRVVMATAAAALCAGVDVHIQGASAVQKSWPAFFSCIEALGVGVTEE